MTFGSYMDRIAIIGLSCLFPGAKNIREFWHNMFEGKASTSSISEDELGVHPSIFFDSSKGKSDKFYFLNGGFIRDFQFDSSGYSFSPHFLESLDAVFQSSIYVAKP